MKSDAYHLSWAATLALLLCACVPTGVPDEASGSGLAAAQPVTQPSLQEPAEGSTAPAVVATGDDPCATFAASRPTVNDSMPLADADGVLRASRLLRSIEPDGVNWAAEWLDSWPRTEPGWQARLDVARAMYPGSAIDALVPLEDDRGAIIQYVLQQLSRSAGVNCANEAAAWIRLLVWPLGSTRSGSGPLGATLDQAVNSSFDICGPSSETRAELILALHGEARMLALQVGPDARFVLLRALQNVVAVRFGAGTEWTHAVDVQLLHTLAGMMPDGCTGGTALNGQAPEALEAIAQSLLALTPAADGSTGDLYPMAPSIALALRFAAGSFDGESITVWAAQAVERGMAPTAAAVSARRLQAAVDAFRENRPLTEAGADLFAPAEAPTDRQERLILLGIQLWESARSGSCTETPDGFDPPADSIAHLMIELIWGHSQCRDSARPWLPLPAQHAAIECALPEASAATRLLGVTSVGASRTFHQYTTSLPPGGTADSSPQVRLGSFTAATTSCVVALPALEGNTVTSVWTPALPVLALDGLGGPALAHQSAAWLRRAYLIQFGSFETLGGGGVAIAQVARTSTLVPSSEQVASLVHAGLPLTALQVDRARVQLAAITGTATDGEQLGWSLRRADVPRMLNGVEFDDAVPPAHISFLNELAEAPGTWNAEPAIQACDALVDAGFYAEANGVPPLFCDSAAQAADFSACLHVAQNCDAQRALVGPDAVNLLLQSLRLGVGTGRVDDSVVASVERALDEQTGYLPASLVVELRARLVQARWIMRDYDGLAGAARATRSLFERAAGESRDWARVYGIIEQLALAAQGSVTDTSRLRVWSQNEQQSDLLELVNMLEESGDSDAIRGEAVELLGALFTSDEAFVPTF